MDISTLLERTAERLMEDESLRSHLDDQQANVVLNRALSWFGVALSAVGILTLVPALYESLAMIFGTPMIVWSVWLGIVLLRRSPAAVSVPRKGDAGAAGEGAAGALSQQGAHS